MGCISLVCPLKREDLSLMCTKGPWCPVLIYANLIEDFRDKLMKFQSYLRHIFIT